MESGIEQSANQEYKNSGSRLPFVTWLAQEREKGKFIFNKKMNDKLATAMRDMQDGGLEKADTSIPAITTVSDSAPVVVVPKGLSFNQKVVLTGVAIITVAYLYKTLVVDKKR